MTGKLVVLPGGGQRSVDACIDCRHSRPHHALPCENHRQCGAYGMDCSNVRKSLQHTPCPRFTAKPAALVRAPRPPGLLRRFWRWLW